MFLLIVRINRSKGGPERDKVVVVVTATVRWLAMLEVAMCMMVIRRMVAVMWQVVVVAGMVP